VGLLDLPAPLFQWIDGFLTDVPALLRLILWGTVGGALSMWLYGVISPQATIARSKREQLEARRSLDGFDGEFADAWPMIRRLLGLSLGHVGRVIGPALLAALPVVCLLVWISTAYGYHLPSGNAPAVKVHPSPLTGTWINGTSRDPRVVIDDGTHGTVAEVPVAAPVPVIEKRHWWNVLIGNPAGYLNDAGPAERLVIALPRREVVGVGPDWLRGWEAPFFVAVLVVSLALKRILRLE
jgi:hypothetical protein